MTMQGETYIAGLGQLRGFTEQADFKEWLLRNSRSHTLIAMGDRLAMINRLHNREDYSLRAIQGFMQDIADKLVATHYGDLRYFILYNPK